MVENLNESLVRAIAICLSSWLISEHIQKMKVLLYHLPTPVPVLRRWIYPTVRLLSSAWRRYLVSDLSGG